MALPLNLESTWEKLLPSTPAVLPLKTWLTSASLPPGGPASELCWSLPRLRAPLRCWAPHSWNPPHLRQAASSPGAATHSGSRPQGCPPAREACSVSLPTPAPCNTHQSLCGVGTAILTTARQLAPWVWCDGHWPGELRACAFPLPRAPMGIPCASQGCPTRFLLEP